MSVADNLQKIVVLCALGVVVIGGAFLLYEDGDVRDNGPTACTADAKICSDGSSVGRTGPNCEFEACPGEDIEIEKPTQNTTRLHTNTQWKFSFSHPSEYEILEELNGDRTVLRPQGKFERRPWFTITVLQMPKVRDISMLPKALFERANLASGELAWIQDPELIDYEKEVFLSMEEFMLGGRTALRVHELDPTAPELGKHRGIIYVLRDPAVYMLTRDLLASEPYNSALIKAENSFKVLD